MSTTVTTPYAVTEAHPQGQATGTRGDWRHRAACRPGQGVHPELFFPVGTSGPALAQEREAKQVCFRCPVASDCLNWALTEDQYAGVAGGMSEDERRDLKRRGYGRKIR